MWRSTIGFDRLFDVFDEVQRTSEDAYSPTISNALARTPIASPSRSPASAPDEVSLTAERNVLTLEGRKAEASRRECGLLNEWLAD